VADPRAGRILWAYPGSGNEGGRPNKILIYDLTTNRFSRVGQELELIWRAGGVATTLEELDNFSASIDDLGISLDSPQWKGGAPQLSAFDQSFQSGNFNGPALTATIETKETEIHAGHRTMLNGFRPLVDGGTVMARVGSRNSQSEAVIWGPLLNLRDSGRFAARANARYHRFRLFLSDEWTDAIGVQVDPHEARKVGRR
jgi:hypothetical protein